MAPRWKGKDSEAKALADPISKIISELQSSLIHSDSQGILSGCSVLLGVDTKQTELLNHTCFGQPIITADKDKQWFQLSLEEAFYMSYSLNCLKVIGEDNHVKDNNQLWDYMVSLRESFPAFYKAYSHLRMKNWVVRSGSQYGVDFVAYRHHPSLVHSEYAVLVSAEEEEGNASGRLKVWSDFHCTLRLCGVVAKTLLVLHVSINRSYPPPKDQDLFEFFFKMSRKTFNYVYSLTMEPMSKSRKYSYSDGNVISLRDRVAIALRRLKSGDSLVSLGETFKTHRSFISQITWSFVEALGENALCHIQWPDTEEEMTCIKSKFESIQGLPNCCGAVDVTHVKMMSSSSALDTEVWIDRMNNQSMVLQAIVDADMRFRDVVSGWPGKMTDSSVLCSSTFFDLCEKGERLNGRKRKLSDGTELNEYIVGDSSFPSLPWLVTPYQGAEISRSRADFNRRHNETWNVAHRALTKLKDEWKVLQGVLWRPDKHKLPRIILACCILHNVFIDMEDQVHQLQPSHEHDPGYTQELYKSPGKTVSGLREQLSLYLSGKLQPQVVCDSDNEI